MKLWATGALGNALVNRSKVWRKLKESLITRQTKRHCILNDNLLKSRGSTSSASNIISGGNTETVLGAMIKVKIHQHTYWQCYKPGTGVAGILVPLA